MSFSVSNGRFREFRLAENHCCTYLFVCVCMYFSKSYVFKRRTRVFPKDTSSSQSMDVTDGSGPSQSMSASVGGASQGGSAVDAPLRGFTVYIVGRLSQSKSELKDLVESLGGRMVKEVSDDTTICLSSTGEFVVAL